MKYLKLVIGLTIQLSVYNSFAQSHSQEYYSLTRQADSLFKIKQYKLSALTYNSAFLTSNGRGLVTDRYNAACAWSKCGFIDSAFYQLFRIATKGQFADYDQVSKDIDLKVLHDDERWGKFLDIVKQNKSSLEAMYNLPVKKELEKIFADDQRLRNTADSIHRKFGDTSSAFKTILKGMKEQDLINQKKVINILDRFGWLGPQQVGDIGSQTLFAVIIHSDLKTMEQFFPMMKRAAQQNDASKQDLAYLEDKIESIKYNTQTYGTQVVWDGNKKKYQFVPIRNLHEINQIRASVGLSSIEEYGKKWGINN